MTTKYRWEIKEITDDDVRYGIQVVTQGEGDADTTAAVLRSLAERLAPTRPTMRNVFGG